MHRDLQFGMRENPASNRRHGSRFAVDGCPRETHGLHGTDESSRLSTITNFPSSTSGVALHAAPHQAATGGGKPPNGALLTVRDVAELLRVPVSWVYGRTRKRALNRLPGYRLGKYWRFSQEEVLAWVKSNGGGSRAT